MSHCLRASCAVCAGGAAGGVRGMCGNTPHMRQAGLLLRLAPSASSSHPCGRGGLLPLLHRKLLASPSPWIRRGPRRGRGHVVEAAKREQDHYAVLGVSRRASAADVKRAYRLLALKYHPDVSRDIRAADLFKSIRLAYEVLSDERRRAQYDMEISFRETACSSHQKNWAYDSEFDDRRRMYKWAELRQRMWDRHRERTTYSTMNNQKESADYERGPFTEVLWSTFFTLFLLRTVGARISLTLCCLAALFDNKLDAGYKMGYVTAWFLGSQGGVLLTMCISYVSWLCGKDSSGLVALAVVAMWIAGHLPTFVPIPQGAIITLLYMSIRLQVDQKYKWGS